MNDAVYKIIKKIPLLTQLSASEINIQKLGGLSNSNFLLSTTIDKYVLRLPKENTNIYINRENEAYNAGIAQKLDLAPNILWQEIQQGKLTGVSLTSYISDTQPLNSNIYKTEELENIASLLNKLQNSKVLFQGELNHKIISKQLSLYYRNCSKKQQEFLHTDYQETRLLLKDKAISIHPAVPSHIDFIKENILIQKKKTWFIDWEYSTMASPFWDIATFCNSVNLEENKADEFLAMVLPNQQNNDRELLQQYRKITKTMSCCWEMALKYTQET